MFLLRRPSVAILNGILASARGRKPTYEAVGATRRDERPGGYRHDRYELTVGTGPEAWERAVEGLTQWVAHSGAGARVFPSDAPLVEGETLLVVLTQGPITVVAPCRIVYVIDEPSRFGFAYGTLPGHPEQGEEAFVVEATRGGAITFTVSAFSHPRELVAKVGGPASRAIQRRVTEKYLVALRRYVAG